jgi:hypothetical protein
MTEKGSSTVFQAEMKKKMVAVVVDEAQQICGVYFHLHWP